MSKESPCKRPPIYSGPKYQQSRYFMIAGTSALTIYLEERHGKRLTPTDGINP
ncbi:unnamed protein product [Cylicocyclus nassatus]|uniref:Uncharacterized protein n=1 Tax=Cylicocyclus nassatus TaxID=53992 RepID=A0AA36M346_CYLNA|nr:unnamed protein product [Cylicocyclus nassatus]